MAEKTTCSFPSAFVDPGVKQGREWCLAYTKAFADEASTGSSTLFRDAQSNYDRLRKYGRGEQSEVQYKELMGLKKENGKYNSSFRNLDFGILKLAPKLRNVLINKVVNQPYRLNVKPIDAKSITEKRQYRSELMELVISQEHIKRSKVLSQLGLTSPLPPGETPPENLAEVDPYMDLHPKDQISFEVKDYLTFSMYYNDWEQLAKEVTGDVVDLGVGGLRPWVDTNGMVRLRRVFPERVIANKCLFPDFRDMIRCGEYYEITVGEYKRLTGGKMGEDHYKMVANKYAEGGQGRYDGPTKDYWQESSFSYAYDPEKITVLDATWLSTDHEVYTEKTNAGHRRMYKEKFDYVPYKGDMSVNEGKGYSDAEFNEKFEGQKQIYRKQVQNCYQCSWIAGSDIAFNWGLMKDQPRSVSNLAETKLPYIFVSTDFTSTIGTIEEVLDQIQMNWLQFQSHVAASKPDGVAIEKRALAKLAQIVPGQKWDPKEALMMYSEIGSFVFDGYDAHGNPLPWLPFKEIKNGMSEAADQHFQKILQLLDMARGMLGINMLTEGQTPPERLGKAVAQLSFGASDNALSHLNDAYSKLYERTARQMVLLMQGSIDRVDEKAFNEALGFESYNVLSLNKDIGLRELGITIEEGPDQYLKDKISIILQKAVDAKEIDAEDAIFIEMEDNIYRQLVMLRKKRLERERRINASQEKIARAQGEEQQKLEKIKGDNAKAQLAATAGAEQNKMAQQFEQDRMIKQEEFMRTVVLEKLKHNGKLEEIEQQWVNKIFETKLKIKSDQVIADRNAEAKENQPVAASN